MAEDTKVTTQPEDATIASGIEPIFITNDEFSALLNTLLINTKFFVATELKEAPQVEGDASVYLINILINNPIINVKSDLIVLLSKYSNNVQLINNPDLKGYHTVGAEIFVKDPVVEEPKKKKTRAKAKAKK
jgi:hypothetical protein